MARGFEPCNFALRHAPLLQPFRGSFQQRSRAFRDAGNRASDHALLILLCHQILALGRHEVRTVDGEKRLSFAQELVRCIREDFLDVTGIPELHVGETCFIDRDIPGHSDFVVDDLAFDAAHSNANALQPFG